MVHRLTSGFKFVTIFDLDLHCFPDGVNGHEDEDDAEIVNDLDLSVDNSRDKSESLVESVVFPPYYFSTIGLSRPSTPTEEDMPRWVIF